MVSASRTPRGGVRAATVSAGIGTRLGASGPATGFARSVLDVVDLIPPGKVMTYGDVAEFLGSKAPRAVGNVMANYGHEVAWWRVLLATGAPTPSHPVEALRKLRGEGTPLLRGGERVDLAAARWDGVRTPSPTRRQTPVV